MADRRPSARAQGYDRRWERVAREFLAAHPICWTPGCGQRATNVDHIRPHKGDRTLFWDRGNWRQRCGRCHARKTARSDGGFGRPVTAPVEPKAVGCHSDGSPRDPTHPWHAAPRAGRRG